MTLVTGDVDEWFERLVDAGAEIIRPPHHSAEYRIYNFFARDPDGFGWRSSAFSIGRGRLQRPERFVS